METGSALSIGHCLGTPLFVIGCMRFIMLFGFRHRCFVSIREDSSLFHVFVLGYRQRRHMSK